MRLHQTLLVVCTVLATVFGSLSSLSAAPDAMTGFHAMNHATPTHSSIVNDGCCEPAQTHSTHCHVDVVATFDSTVGTPIGPATRLELVPTADGRPSIVSGFLDPPRV